MNYREKTRDELIVDLKKLQQEYDSLKTLYETDITERKKVEEVLRNSENLYRDLVENCQYLMCTHDLQGHILSANPWAAKVLGYEMDTILQMNIRDFLVPELRRGVELYIARIRKNGTAKGTLLIQTATGERRIWEYNNTLRTEGVGNPIVRGIARDITERKQAEESLKQALDWQETIFEGSRDSIFISDQDARFIAVNKAACDLTGYSRDQLLKMRISDIHDLPDLNAYKMYHQRIFDGEEILSEAKILRSDGVKIDTEFNNRCVSIAGKLYMHTTARNITERKQVEEELVLLAHSVRSISEIVSITDRENKILFVNEAFLKTYGYTLEELIGKSISIVRPTTTEPAIDDILNATFQGGWQGELINQKKDGTKFPIALSTSVVCNEKGVKIALVGIARDITEPKKMEEALETSREQFRISTENMLIPFGIYSAIRDMSGKILDFRIKFVNDAACKDNLMTREEQIGKNLCELLPFHKETGLFNDYCRVMETGQPLRKDSFIYDNFNGKKKLIRAFEINAAKLGDGFTASWRDITERRRVEEALYLEKENFRNTMDDSPLGVRIATLEGDTIYANKTLLDLYGYDNLGELQKIPLKDRYTPESYLQAQQRKQQRERGDFSVIEYEISIVRKDGEIHHLRVFRKEVLWNSVRQFQVIYEDITERKRVEEALRESEARFRALFQNSLLGISLAQPGGGLLHVNPAYARMYGFENPEILLAEVPDTRVFFANQKEREDVIMELQRKGFIEAREFELIRRDGSHFFALVSAGEIKDSNGKLLYLQASHIDLTERKKMEEELRSSKELLEKLNIHLTEIREEERASISREIHDQLGQSMTALKLDLNRMYKYLDNNPEAAAKLKSMIELVSDTIKNVQRISSDLRPGILDELGLVSAIEWYCDEFEKRSGIKCNLKLDNSDFSDSQINLVFFRILQETLTNVLRHANASSVSINLHQSEKGVTMTIQDNGIGITKEQIESFRSLGLISMRERVKQFKGTIDISSKKENGTKLVIFIPS